MSELQGELNNQSTRISKVKESMSNKLAEVEKPVSSVEKAMSTKIEDSITNIKEQIKNEVERCLKLQPKQLCEQTVPMPVSYTHLDVYKRQEQYKLCLYCYSM